MQLMRDQHIARLEARLESLIEGAFAQLFGRSIKAQDIALQLARAMEDGLLSARQDDPRPIAPDHYRIDLNPTTAYHLLERQPQLAALLSTHMVELAANVSYRLDNPPLIHINPQDNLLPSQIRVFAEHTANSVSNTNILEKVVIDPPAKQPENPYLLIDQRTVPLSAPLINIGRSTDNNIVLDDPQVSRHHAQLRLRFGHYMLFDAKSQTGTLVNNTPITEHTLRTGDVIRMGGTRLVYLEDDQTEQTTTNLQPVDPSEL